MLQENLLIQESQSNPYIFFNANNGILEISGFAGLHTVEEYEESVEHWIKSLMWVEEYIKNPKPNTQFICKLKFFNTQTPKYLLKMFRELEFLSGLYTAEILWFVEKDDEDILEFIDDLNVLLNKIKIQVIIN